MVMLGSRTEVSLRKVLFATDFSSSSVTALQYGLGLFRHYHPKLFTVNIVSPEITYDIQPPDPFYLRHSAEDQMSRLASSGLFKGIKHFEVVEEGFNSISEELLELINRLQIDLIILGTHGRGGIKQLVLGSVAEEIVNRAPCAVLTVGPHVPPKLMSEVSLRRILCATDLQRASTRVFMYALMLAQDAHAQLTLLHVLKVPTSATSEYQQSQREGAMKQLMHLIPPETNPAVESHFIVEIGAPAERIPKVAEDQGADLIVIGPHHTSHPRVSAHLPWAMLHHVLSHSRCPVLKV